MSRFYDEMRVSKGVSHLREHAGSCSFEIMPGGDVVRRQGERLPRHDPRPHHLLVGTAALHEGNVRTSLGGGAARQVVNPAKGKGTVADHARILEKLPTGDTQ